MMYPLRKCSNKNVGRHQTLYNPNINIVLFKRDYYKQLCYKPLCCLNETIQQKHPDHLGQLVL